MASGDRVVHIDSGDVRGRVRADGVWEHLAIPYAAPPVGPLRFRPPLPVAAWDGARDATRRGAAPIQPPSRGEALMGPMVVGGYDEDCLTLNVWSPSADPAADLPVLVWLHGGGFMFGAGSAAFYDGDVLAQRDLVVVTVNYRLGAFGFLHVPDAPAGPAANLGLQDQCLALDWVQRNIAAFGGDPGRVTVAGQSAGGISIVGLHAMPRAKGLFQRAIVWSSGLQLEALSTEAAADVTRTFYEAAGLAPDDADGLVQLPADQLVAAQEATLLQFALRAGGDPRLRPAMMAPFQLVVDGDVLPTEPTAAALAGSMDDTDLLIGVNSDEMGFVFAPDPGFWDQTAEQVDAQVRGTWGDLGVEAFARYAARRPDQSAPQVLARMLSEEGAVPSIRLVERRAEVGRPAYLGWFTWPSPALDGRIGASHTVELPFAFGTWDRWADAPMLAGADPDELLRLGDALQGAWAWFAATGRPGPDWPPYEVPGRIAMELGTRVGPIEDPAPDRTEIGLTFMPHPA